MKKKPKFKPCNKQQAEAIANTQAFITSGKATEWYMIEGKAGTGKTTIVQEVIKPFVGKKRILIMALAHKAKLVLAEKIRERYGRGSVSAETIASATGMGMDMETGEFSPQFGASTFPPITETDIIICDEASMVNEQALELIMDRKHKRAIVIFLGDIGQLPPIRKAEEDHKEDPSPTFSTRNKSVLTERVRQGELSPILPYADYYWNNSRRPDPKQNPVPDEARTSIVTLAGSLVFSRSGSVIPAIMHLYDQAVREGKPELIKTIVYRNNVRATVNNVIRTHLFGNDAWMQIKEGELLIFTDNHTIQDIKISNATEIQALTAVEDITSDGWNIITVGISYNGNPMELQILNRAEQARYTEYLNQMAYEIKRMPFGDERHDAWIDFYKKKNRFAPVDYAYAITAHKAQGSTYDVVLVAEHDVMCIGVISNKAKSKAIYTAITRAKTLAIIMDGTRDEKDSLTKALDLIQRESKKIDGK